MDDKTWLDSWKPRRLPATFLAAKRWATRSGRADDVLIARAPQRPMFTTLADTMGILRYGKKAWREMQQSNANGQLSGGGKDG